MEITEFSCIAFHKQLIVELVGNLLPRKHGRHRIFLESLLINKWLWTREQFIATETSKARNFFCNAFHKQNDRWTIEQFIATETWKARNFCWIAFNKQMSVELVTNLLPWKYESTEFSCVGFNKPMIIELVTNLLPRKHGKHWIFLAPLLINKWPLN